MRINDPISNPRLVLESVRSSTLSSLRPGQIVEARVLPATSEGTTRLRIGNAAINARTPLQFSTGQRLTLLVVNTATPVTLKLVRDAGATETQTRALRSALPRQQPLGQLMGRMDKLAVANESPLRTAADRPAAATKPVSADSSSQVVRQAGRETALPNTTAATRALPTPTLPTPAAAPSAVSKTTAPGSVVAGTSATGPMSAASPAPVLTQSVQQVLGHFLSADEPLTPARLRQALDQSGLFLEARLAQGGNPGTDLKADLLRLLMQLALAGVKSGQQAEQTLLPRDTGQQQTLPAPLARWFGELLHQAEAALARVLVNQIGSVPQAESTQQIWAFDLPIRQPQGSDDFMLKISRENADGGADGAKASDTAWTVNLQFDLAGLGPVSSRITLRGDEISGHFSAEHAGTAERLTQALPKLDRAFARIGLKVGNLSAAQGKTGDNESVAAWIPRLLDEKA